MPVIRVAGVLPGIIAENSRPSDWYAALSLSGDLTGLVAIETTGPGALYFSATYDAANGLAILRPAAPVDYEAFAALNRLPQLSFSLRFDYADRSTLDDATVYTVTVQNLDDTPPQALRFTSGGQVEAGAIGAVIGTLAVTDPDSAGPFFFTFTADDDWRFEVIGTTLKLKDGFSLGLDDVGTWPLILSVSDGLHAAAFTLPFTVLAPGTTPPPPPPVLGLGQQQGGILLAAPDRAVSQASSASITGITAPGDGALHLALADGSTVLLPGSATTLQLADGAYAFDPHGKAAEAAALYQALGLGPDAATLAGAAATLDAGGSAAGLAETLPGLLAGTDAEFVAGLYQHALGRGPEAGELAAQLGRLADGLGR
ncbi:MAG TPA: hypothetical protein VE684_21385, partial [Crenalkalicoccus sp.]|nr:hypothetical protein [Crenalkalicoccus sp.]